MDDKEKEKRLQEKFIEYQMVQQQVGQIQKQLQQVSSQKTEVRQLKQSLSDLKNVEAGKEMLVPVCSGIFAKAKLIECSSLFVNVGSNVVVKKDLPSVNEMLGKQVDEIKNVEAHLSQHLQRLAEKSAEIEAKLDAMIKEAKENV